MKLSKHLQNLPFQRIYYMTFIMFFCGFTGKSSGENQGRNAPGKDTAYVHELLKLSRESHHQSRIREQLWLADQAFALSDSLGYTKGKGHALIQKGIAYRELGDKVKAVHHLTEADKIFTLINDQEGKARAYLVMANAYDRAGEYDHAVEFALKALAGSESIHDSSGMGSSFSTLGVLHFRRGDLELAGKYYNNAILILTKTKRKIALANIYNNLGALWRDRQDDKKALSYFQHAASINFEEKNYTELWTNYTNMGVSHERLKEFHRARELHQKSIAICRSSDFRQGLATSYLNLASTYFSSGDLAMSTVYLDSSLKIAKELKNHMVLQSIYFALSEVAHASGKDDKAYHYFKLFSIEKDSVFNQEKNDKIDRLQTAFESEKKDRQIELLHKDQALKNSALEQQRTISYATAFGLLAVLGFSSALIVAYRSKHKTNRQLLTANNLIEEKSKILEEKNKDITDSITYAKTIQEAILPKRGLFSKFDDHFVLFQPRDIVSGDFYFITHLENEIILAAADCTGHGVPGAFMSLIGNELLQRSIEKKISDPASILLELNSGIRSALQQQGEPVARDGMDLAIGVFDLSTMQLRTAAAHRPVYIVRNNVLTEIKPDKISIGHQPTEEVRFSTTYYHLQKGDWIYFTSDGYADQFGGSEQKKLLSKNLRNLLITHSREEGEMQKVGLLQAFSNWKGHEEQIDDVMIIGVRV